MRFDFYFRRIIFTAGEMVVDGEKAISRDWMEGGEMGLLLN